MLTKKQIEFMEREKAKMPTACAKPVEKADKVEEAPPLPYPIIRANSEEIRLIFSLFAAEKEFGKIEERMEKRLRAIPNAWRQMRLIHSLSEKLAEKLVMTLPYEKLVGMRRMIPHMHYKVVCGDQAAHEKDVCVIDNDNMDVVLDAAHEKCKMCIDGDCSKCKLGRTLDRIVSYDRDGTPWSEIDMEAIE